MSDLLRFRLHRFDALHALLVGDTRKRTPDSFIENNHLRRDIGLPDAERPAPLRFAAPLVGLRR
ncbi:hypothetical protein [Tropicimonas marinistellae]|uniref:hypothetical protein n=1 Tax=Tropicimonas marinistellae TaxID=1739787 RepID=UPI000829EF89|nr:hypothetical protein [Tropicimonas marinistellae]